jgi:hypothetical protein
MSKPSKPVADAAVKLSKLEHELRQAMWRQDDDLAADIEYDIDELGDRAMLRAWLTLDTGRRQ